MKNFKPKIIQFYLFLIMVSITNLICPMDEFANFEIDDIIHHIFSKSIATQSYSSLPTLQEKIELSTLPTNTIIEKYPFIKILERQPQNQRYGVCHNYAISKKLNLKGKIPETLTIIGTIDWYSKINFIQKYCDEVSIPQKGDIIVYYNDSIFNIFFSPTIEHTGLVYDENLVESKWETRQEVLIHPTWWIPESYGTQKKYYRMKTDPNNILNDIKEQIPQYNYRQACAYINNMLVQYAEQEDNNSLWHRWQGFMCSDIEATNDKRQSILMIAARTGNNELASAIYHEADLEKRDVNGKTALDLAKENGNQAIVYLLKREQIKRSLQAMPRKILNNIVNPSKIAKKHFYQTTS